MTPHAHCLSTPDGHPCPWTAEGETADREAEKHVKAAGHGTCVHRGAA
jgi:hypothetical protein